MINNDINHNIQNIKKNLYQNVSFFFRNHKNNYNLSEIISGINILFSNTLFELENLYKQYYKDIYKKNKFSDSELKIKKECKFNKIIYIKKDKLLIPLPNKKFLTSDDIKSSIKDYFENIYNHFQNIRIRRFNFSIISENENKINLDDNQDIPPIIPNYNNQIKPINVDNNPIIENNIVNNNVINDNFSIFNNNNIDNFDNYPHRKMFILNFNNISEVKYLKQFLNNYNNLLDFQLRENLEDHSIWVFLEFAGRVILNDPFINTKIKETNSYNKNSYLNFFNAKGILLNPQTI